ncbi:MAG: Ig-like domain-containing protein [Desulfotomaculaceae bacterium]|nr:Ig-like domain-containing protein [Desulfotomaculaceae bacterium]
MEYTIPKDKETGVPVDTTITVSYNRRVSQNNLEQVYLRARIDGIYEVVDINTLVDDKKLIIKPVSELKHDTKYTVIIYEGAVKGYPDCTYADTETFSFTTESICLDMNDDGIVDILDMLWIASKIGPVNNSDAGRADVNSDDQVNVLDIMFLSQNLVS